MPEIEVPVAEVRAADESVSDRVRAPAAERFRRHHNLALAGAGSMVGGAVVLAGTGLLAFSAGDRRGAPVPKGFTTLVAGGLVTGGALYVGGQGAMTYGSIAAAYDLHDQGARVSPALGFVGAGMSLAGAGLAVPWETSGVGWPLLLAGTAVTGTQVIVNGVAGRNLRGHHLAVTPTRNGLRVSGTW